MCFYSALDALKLFFEALPEHRGPNPVVTHGPRAGLAVPYAELLTDGDIPTRDWTQASSYQPGAAQELRLSVAYALSSGLGEWWSSGAFGALQALLEALHKHYDIPLECPLDDDGNLLTGVHKPSKRAKFKGVVNHYNLSKKKWDTLGLQLDQILEEIRDLKD